MTDPISIKGLKQFNKDLKTLDKDLPKATRVAFNRAADVIVAEARPKVPKGPHNGRARRSVKAQSTRTEARVKGGGGRALYYPWLDFGGKVGRRGAVKRPFLKEGRYIYRAYFDKRRSGEFQEILEDALMDVAKQAGIEITD